MSNVEQGYDQFVSFLRKTSEKVDPDLLMKVMYLERKLPDVEPKVDLDIQFTPGVNIEEKRFRIHDELGLDTAPHGQNGVLTSGRMNALTIVKLASHPSVISVAGNATAASY